MMLKMKKGYKLFLMVTLMAVGRVCALAQNNYERKIDNNGAYIYRFTGDYSPKVWETAGFLKGDEIVSNKPLEGNIIKMYFGGWKYQDNTPFKDNNTYLAYSANFQGRQKEIADSWGEAGLDGDYVAAYKQYYYSDYSNRSWGIGDNARSEFAGENIFAKYHFDFKGFGKGNPFTVPCIGTFLKFEPARNGDLEVYIIQNGIVDLSLPSSSGGSPKLDGKATWRPLYIVDELGNLLDDDDVKVEIPDDGNKMKIYIGWNGASAWGTSNGAIVIPNADGGGTGYYLPQQSDVGDNVAAFLAAVSGDLGNDKTNLKTKLSDEQWRNLTGTNKDGTTATGLDRECPYWTAGGTELRMMPPKHSKDGWVAINKTYARYTFEVKAGKSYYMFMNDSQLGFCGYEFKPETASTQELTLREDEEDGIGNPIGTYKKVTLERTFHKGWNAICLPFSVTEDKMREWFGSDGKTEDYELVTYNGIGVHNNRVKAFFFRHVYQDILAGYPYMLYIPEGAKALENDVEFEDITIENEGYDIKSFTKSSDYINDTEYPLADFKGNYLYAPERLSKESLGEDYTFIGFYEPITLKKNSYVVTEAGLQWYGDDTYGSGDLEMNGLRAYMQGNQSSGTNELVKISGTNFTSIMDDMEEWNATVIDGIAEEMGFFSRPSNVYSISGQLIRPNSTSLVGLPKGIYIVNGKKYFVNK